MRLIFISTFDKNEVIKFCQFVNIGHRRSSFYMDISIVNKGAIRLVDGKIIHVTDDNNPGNSFERLETIGLILVDGRSGISSLHEDNLKNSDFFERIKQYIGKLSSG